MVNPESSGHSSGKPILTPIAASFSKALSFVPGLIQSSARMRSPNAARRFSSISSAFRLARGLEARST